MRTRKSQHVSKKILEMIIQDPHVTLRDLQEEMGFAAVSSVNYHVADLIARGLLQRPEKFHQSFTVTEQGYKECGYEIVTCPYCGLPKLDRIKIL